MPLNLKDNPEDSADEKQTIGPILHEPGVQKHIPASLVITVILILLLGLAGVLVYKSGVWKKLRSRQTEQAQAPAVAQPEAQPIAPAPTPDTLRAAAEMTRSAPPAVREEAMSSGRYTIYVARQKERERADEETGRWKDAGYPAVVIERDGWYCVAVGRYGTREEARDVAEKLKEGLEGGYWVSTLE